MEFPKTKGGGVKMFMPPMLGYRYFLESPNLLFQSTNILNKYKIHFIHIFGPVFLGNFMKFDAFLCLNWRISTEQRFLAIYQILIVFVVILGGYTGAPPLFELGGK